MRHGALDGIGMPLAAFIEQGRGGRAEAVGGQVVRPVTQAAQSGVEGVLAYRAAFEGTIDDAQALLHGR